jgi:hypothetical protein
MKREKRANTEPAGHYVYVYRDGRGKVRYVGYGSRLDRAVSRNRSEPMREFLHQGKYTIEIAGPYGSKDVGLAVETALISLLQPDLNSSRAPGPSRFRFRPLGIPEPFAERLSAAPLTEADLARIGDGDACPFLFVPINSRDFHNEVDPRPGYSLDAVPSDSEILARLDRWWQIGRYVDVWRADPRQSPRTLVGVTGPPTHRIIIGAVSIDPAGWRSAQPDFGRLYQVPTLPTPRLDAHGLRGRLISPSANIRFGAVRSQHFVILDCAGRTIGGRQ